MTHFSVTPSSLGLLGSAERRVPCDPGMPIDWIHKDAVPVEMLELP